MTYGQWGSVKGRQWIVCNLGEFTGLYQLDDRVNTVQNAGSRLLEIVWSGDRTDSEDLRYPATIFVWVRWFLFVACVIEAVYRPVYTHFTYSVYALCLMGMAAYNGYVHYLVSRGREVKLHWILVVSALDVFLVTVGMVLYYPALAWFAVFFNSFKLSFAWVTLVAIIYTTVSLTAGEGLDFEAREEKALFARIVVMYAVVASVNLVSRFERTRRQEAVERERELQRQRIEISQTIHDTSAQWAYMVALGVESAMDLVDRTDEQLMEKLRVAAELSRSAMWELRHPIDGGQLFRGEELGDVLEAHAATFTVITSVPAELVRHGTEPPLSTIARSLLFSIAHNALANVMRHARANRVVIDLDYGDDQLRMSVIDDGIGLPRGYESRGHGFRNMRADAERMEGDLKVLSNEPGGGTTVSCLVPYRTITGGE